MSGPAPLRTTARRRPSARRRVGARGAALAALAAVLGAAAPAHAHEFRAAALRIEPLDRDRFVAALQPPPASAAGPLGEDALALRFPDGCAPEGSFVRCAPGVAARWVEVVGLDTHPVEVVVRFAPAAGEATMAVLDPASPRFVFGGPGPADPGALAAFGRFVGVGVEHIVFGYDHLLFVLGLLFLVPGARRLVGTLTAFTVAHSVTLALAVLDVVTLAGPPVEAVIALSVLLLAAEAARALRQPDAPPTLLRRHPALVAFGFGLVHGLGFAGALAEVGLPPTRVPAALAGFNVGVELGQVGVVVVALAIARAVPPALRTRRLALLAVYGMGTVAAAWSLARLGGVVADLV